MGFVDDKKNKHHFLGHFTALNILLVTAVLY